MTIDTIAIMAPGNMGHAVGAHLVREGLRVITNLEGRSADTKARANKAGMDDVASDEALVREADIVLSILPPGRAVAFAQRIAKAIKATSAEPLFVDCNAISPATAAEVAGILDAVGIKCVDAAIRGGPASAGKPQPRIYASGPGVAEFQALNDFGLDIRDVGPIPGQASGLKMCAAAVSKGLVVLTVQAFVAARVLGIDDDLRKELEGDATVSRAARRAPNLGPDAYRWAEEMDEIAATVASTGLTPKILEGMAEFCRFVEATPLGAQKKGQLTLGRDFDEVVEVLAGAISKDIGLAGRDPK